MVIAQKWRKIFEEEQKQWLAWQDAEVEQSPPPFVDAPIRNPEKFEAYCQMAAERIREGVVFEENDILEILPCA